MDAELYIAQNSSKTAQKQAIAPEAMYLYQQYRYSAPIADFWKVLNLYIREKYFDYLTRWQNDLDIREGVSFAGGVGAEHTDYVKFFAQHYFGIPPLLGPNSLLPKYDTSLTYDDIAEGRPKTFYDEAGDYDGTISAEEMMKYLWWVVNYGAPVMNIPQAYSFAAIMCGIADFREIGLVNRPDRIQIVLPQREECRNFVTLVSNYYNLSGLPLGIDLEYVLRGNEDAGSELMGVFYE